jgi:hypothetical protein
MKLYVCWGTFQFPGGHACGNAYDALKEAGHEPEIQRTYGSARLPGFLNPMRGKVRELTGQNWVPVLVTDQGEVVKGSKNIVAWARAHQPDSARNRA